jgi:thioredoxin 1
MTEIIELNDDNFEQRINSSELPSVVDFYSNFCSPCKAMEPLFEKAAEIYKGKANFYKLNVDKNTHIPSSKRILGIPTIIIFKEGKEIDRLMGFQNIDSLSDFIRRNL